MGRKVALATVCLLICSMFAFLTQKSAGWDYPDHGAMAEDTLRALGWPEGEIVNIPGYVEQVDFPIVGLPHNDGSCHRVEKYQRVFESYGGEYCSFMGAEKWASEFVELAKTAYASGDIELGKKNLGYAIHFIQDAVCPPHVFPFSEIPLTYPIPHTHFEAYAWLWYNTTRNNWQALVRNAPAELITSANDLRTKVEEAADWVNATFQPPRCSYVRQDWATIGDLSGTLGGWKMTDDDIGGCIEKAASLVKGAAAWANPYATMQTCYIRADGSLDPPTVPVERNGDFYTFTNNSLRSIVVERDDIVVDGAQNVLQGTSLPNSVAIEINGRHNVTIENLEIRSFDIGVFLRTSSYIEIINNRFLRNGIFLGNTVTNEGVGYFNTHTIEGNTLNGKPIYYYKNTDGMKVPTDAGSVLLANCTNFNVQNLNASSGTVGIELAYTSDSTISNNEATNKWYGLYLHYASGNFISNNNASNNIVGVYLDCCNNNGVFDNNFSDNFCGIRLGMGSVYNSISRNLVSNSYYGTYISDHSDNNEIIHNNFLHNQYQISLESANFWDDGYPSGGNYWSDFNGTDLYSGLYQNQTGSDGIGDTPYLIDANNIDHYPLMSPWTPPDAAALNISSFKTIVGEGFPANVTVALENQGSKIEELNTTFYANETCIGYQTFMLRSNNSVIYSSDWNVSGLPKGNYSLSVSIVPLEGETDLNDNSVNGSWVFITIPGDLNGDKTVNILDAIILSNHFGFNRYHPAWDANVDMNEDGIINILDAILVANNFGKSWT